MILKNKVVLILSPQAWGNMFLSKHHYAIELAKLGNEVYFLNPPQQQKINNNIEILESNVIKSLYLINHSLSFPKTIKFKFYHLFHFLMKLHIKKLRKEIGKEIDIVWSFDLGSYYPFKYFSKKSYKIFNPVDLAQNKFAIDSANGAQIMFATAQEYMDYYTNLNIPKHLILHGLSEEFVVQSKITVERNNKIHFGLSGNWVRADVDRDCILKIVNENPEIVFEFWGSYKAIQSNIGGMDSFVNDEFIAVLKNSKNVILHGPVHPSKLAKEYQRMDGFIVCYDIIKDQSRGTNYHKVMEYLSTGKVVVANNITTYAAITNLIEMTSSRTDNDELPALFKKVVTNLKHYNNDNLSKFRQEFAFARQYPLQINKIEHFINDAYRIKNKTILLISPQSWGNMFLAKHHYAIELAKHGNEVYFLNPPQLNHNKERIVIEKSGVEDSLFLIQHSLPFSYKIKFKFITLFHFLMQFHIKKIEQKIGKKIDIVWNFDLGNYYPFKQFSNSPFKLYNPVDEPLNKFGIDSAKNCDVIISITKEILEKYKDYDVPKHFIHHGLAEEFADKKNNETITDKVVKVGLSGNWLRKDLDTKCLLQIIKENENIVFEFWGSYQERQSNIGGGNDAEVKEFIGALTSAKNVILHGPIPPKKLAVEFKRIDIFLICYDILRDQCHGTNYHKVMEYLSTGKVIVSNNITTYSTIPNLIEMTNSRTHNGELPQLFKTVVNNLQHYNQPNFISLRREFAINNLYSKKISEIESLITQ